MGITMLVCLTGLTAQHAMRHAAELLEKPSTVDTYADPRAEWPSGADARGASRRLVELIIGLVCGGLRSRMPLESAVAALEALADEAHLMAGVSDADDSRRSAHQKECMICMAAPRSVRYACGHLTCCADCTQMLLFTEGERCPQNMCPTCRARIVVLGTGTDLAYEATFVQQACPPPPPVEMPRAAAPRAYPPGHRVAADFGPGPIGAFLSSRYDALGNEVGVMISRVDAASQADQSGLPAGAVIVEVNGRPAAGLHRADISRLAQHRPFSLVVQVPTTTAAAAARAPSQAQADALRALPPADGGVPLVVPGVGARAAPRGPAVPRSGSSTAARQASPSRRRASPLRRLIGRG